MIKRGHPLLLGEELVVNTSVVVGVANGVVASEGDYLLACSGILRSQGTGQRTYWVEWGS